MNQNMSHFGAKSNINCSFFKVNTMGTTKNILMQEFNGVDYDTLYPSIQPNFPNDLANMYIWGKWKKDFAEETKILDASYLFLLGGEDKDLTMSVSDGYDFD